MQQSVKERIILFIKKKGLSQKKFEKAAGLSNGYINSLRKSPTAEKMRSIIDAFPEINPQWLLTGEGEMLNQELSKTDVQKPKDEENQPSNDNSAAPDVLNKPKKYDFDVEEEIRQLRNEVERLKALLNVKNEEIDFYRATISSALKIKKDEE